MLTLELLFSERDLTIDPTKAKTQKRLLVSWLQQILVEFTMSAHHFLRFSAAQISELKAEKHSALTISYSPGNFSQQNSSTFFKLYKIVVQQPRRNFYNGLTSITTKNDHEEGTLPPPNLLLVIYIYIHKASPHKT